MSDAHCAGVQGDQELRNAARFNALIKDRSVAYVTMMGIYNSLKALPLYRQSPAISACACTVARSSSGSKTVNVGRHDACTEIVRLGFLASAVPARTNKLAELLS